MGLKIEDALPKAKWAEFARLKNRIDPREVVPALPNKYFPIVVRAASRDELEPCHAAQGARWEIPETGFPRNRLCLPTLRLFHGAERTEGYHEVV